MDKVMFTGFLKSVPEKREKSHQVSLYKFEVLTDELFRRESDDFYEEITVYGKLPDISQNDFEEGKLVFVNGLLSKNLITYKDGRVKEVTSVIANDVELINVKEAA